MSFQPNGNPREGTLRITRQIWFKRIIEIHMRLTITLFNFDTGLMLSVTVLAGSCVI